MGGGTLGCSGRSSARPIGESLSSEEWAYEGGLRETVGRNELNEGRSDNDDGPGEVLGRRVMAV